MIEICMATGRQSVSTKPTGPTFIPMEEFIGRSDTTLHDDCPCCHLGTVSDHSVNDRRERGRKKTRFIEKRSRDQYKRMLKAIS